MVRVNCSHYLPSFWVNEGVREGNTLFSEYESTPTLFVGICREDSTMDKLPRIGVWCEMGFGNKHKVSICIKEMLVEPAGLVGKLLGNVKARVRVRALCPFLVSVIMRNQQLIE